MNPPRLDRLVILSVSGSQAGALMTELGTEGFRFTIIQSTGGILNEPVVCLLVGFSHPRMQVLLEIIRKNCKPYRKYISAQGLFQGELANIPMVEAQLGGALIHMMNVERFEQF